MMKVLIASDIHFYHLDNKIYVSEKLSSIFKRYHDSFGKIVLCSRVHKKKSDARLVDVTAFIEKTVVFRSFAELYSYQFGQQLRNEILQCDLVIGRFEAFSAIRAFDIASKLRKPFFSEVMSDPWDGLWNHGLAGKIVAPYSFYKTKKALAHSNYALYVTNEFLQRRYPCPNKSIGVSNVLIEKPEQSVLDNRLRRIENCNIKELTLMTTAATYVRYKGQEYVIRAIPELLMRGINVKYILVGEGSQDYLKKVAKDCGVDSQVIFKGRLPLNEVLLQLDDADIYIQPSLQEGLPRAVIEAMSRGCPCLGSRTAGIPELLQPECVFEKKSVSGIAEKIEKLADYSKMKTIAIENFNKAEDYSDEVLSSRRLAYYQYVVDDLKKMQ